MNPSRLLLACGLLVAAAGCGIDSRTPVTVGAILPLSGPHAGYGSSIKKGLVLALAHELGKPQKGAYTIRILYRDSRSDPEQGRQAMRELIKESGVPLVITVSSEVTLACAPLARNTETVLITARGTAPDITNQGKWVYRNSSTDVMEAYSAASYLLQTSSAPIAMAVSRRPHGQALAAAFEKYYNGKKRPLAARFEFDPRAEDYGELVAALKKEAPKSLFIAGYYGAATRLMVQARQSGLKTQFMLPSSFYVNQVLLRAPKELDGTLIAHPAYDPTSTESPLPEFVGAFKDRYGMIPDLYSAAAYDVGKLAIIAVDIGGTKASDIKQALNRILRFKGTTGETTFDENGDAARVPQISTIKDGQFVRIR